MSEKGDCRYCRFAVGRAAGKVDDHKCSSPAMNKMQVGFERGEGKNQILSHFKKYGWNQWHNIGECSHWKPKVRK